MLDMEDQHKIKEPASKTKQPSKVAPTKNQLRSQKENTGAVLLRADPDVLDWWSQKALFAGMSRNTLIADILALLSEALENEENELMGPPEGMEKGFHSFGFYFAEDLAIRRIAGPQIRLSLMAYYVKKLQTAMKEAAEQAGDETKGKTLSTTIRLLTDRLKELGCTQDEIIGMITD